MHWTRRVASKKNFSRLLLSSFIASVVIFNIRPYSFGTVNFDMDSKPHSMETLLNPAASTLSNNFQGILNANKNIKTILLWNSFWFKHFSFGIGQDPFVRAGCPVTNCAIWDQADGNSSLPHDSFDAVVFHAISLMRAKKNQIPQVRRPSQLYSFMLLETPATNKFNFFPYKDLFNLTMTYRRDSDIYTPYGWIVSKDIPEDQVRRMSPSRTPSTTEWMEPRYENMNISLRRMLTKKTKAVGWFVSHCYPPSQRQMYVEELCRHIGVDIYGWCGPLKCDGRSQSKCYETVEETYMFYLSFENSLCKDYVTEKLFSILEYNVVPVVYGGVEYDKIAPPMSYINAKDYSSPQELANYLNYLMKTPEEYEKYFWWKQYYRVVSNTFELMFCTLCEILNSAPQQRIHTDIERWWNAPGMCHDPKTKTVWTDLHQPRNINASSFCLADRAPPKISTIRWDNFIPAPSDGQKMFGTKSDQFS